MISFSVSPLFVLLFIMFAFGDVFVSLMFVLLLFITLAFGGRS